MSDQEPVVWQVSVVRITGKLKYETLSQATATHLPTVQSGIASTAKALQELAQKPEKTNLRPPKPQSTSPLPPKEAPRLCESSAT